MSFTRKNVYDLGGDWADTILWYARGVAAMKATALAEPTAWRFYGGIHGFDRGMWQALGYFSSTDKLPSSADQKRYWKQCQHGSWYFLPWHRGYLLAYEANIRAAVVKLGGPADWALPYWNYFKADEQNLPPAFASPDWPDGTGNNPLFVKQRYGPNNDGNVFIPLDQVNLDALSDPDFTGVASGGDPGFGGVDTGFSHGGPVHGAVESQPHDMVHVLVGGGDPSNPQLPGLMSDPDTAGLDPIFYLHHANIDRLWQVWRQNPPTDTDPTEANWLKGPVNTGGRKFSMPMPDGTGWDYTPADMVDLAKLGYTYDDLSPAVAAPAPESRALALGARPSAAKKGAAMPRGKNVELVGANEEPLQIRGNGVRSSVQLDQTVRRKVAASLSVSGEEATPDRVYLNLENVRGLADATSFKVYIALPENATPADHPENLAGTVALFGVRKASVADDEQAGQGLNFVLDITNIIDSLHLRNALDTDQLDVRIVPVKPVPDAAQITVGRISIYRQGS
jgi:tyrosinase